MFVIKTGNVTTAEGDTLYQYDGASRLISVTQPNGETVSYTYDSHGNRASMTYPNGKTVKYTYDDMNRLIAVKGVDGETTKYEYDALGRRIATDGAKEDTVYTYDEVGNLVSQTTTGAYDLALEYAYDLSGRMTQESRTENGATLTSSYIYDALGQLTGFSRSDGQSETYTYDPVGNMTAKTQNGVQTAMRYNAANQLTQSVRDADKTTYTYDANGNLVRSENAGGARSYAYNALNLLQSFTREDGYTETYTYNANRLLSGVATSDGLTSSLTWDILYGDGVVISESKNGEATSYTYGLERVSALTGSTRTEYVYDGRGSVAAEVSYNDSWYTLGGNLGKVTVSSKSYTPFGEQLGEATSGFGYNGEYYNAATGMIYLRARFYEPEMNRFSQKDTLRGSITDGASLNRYLYCQSDPVNFADYNGRQMVALNYDGYGGGRSRQTTTSKKENTSPPKVTIYSDQPKVYSNSYHEYQDQKRNAVTPNPQEYTMLRNAGYAGSFSQYAIDKSHTQFPSYQEYMQGKTMDTPYYVTYNNGRPTPVSYQRTYYANNQSNNATNSVSQDTPEVYDVIGGQGYSCGRDTPTSDSSIRKSLLSFLISAEETLSISHIKALFKSYYQEIANARHLALAEKTVASNHIGRLNKPTSFLALGAILDFGTQVLFGETYASAGIKTAAHVGVGIAATVLVGLTALTGGAAIGVAVVATIGLNLLADYVYDKYLKEAVDNYLPYSLYG